MRRVERVSAVLKQELALMIDKILNERFGIVTLTEVELQSDLKQAKVYVTCFDTKMEKQVIKTLEERRQEIQLGLGRRLKMKFTPKLIFLIDEGLENVNKVESLLRKVKKDN